LTKHRSCYFYLSRQGQREEEVEERLLNFWERLGEEEEAVTICQREVGRGSGRCWERKKFVFPKERKRFTYDI